APDSGGRVLHGLDAVVTARTGTMIESPVLQQRGLIVKSPGASLGMRGLARDFAHCLSGSAGTYGKRFRSFARIGRIRRRPTVFLPIIASAKLTFCLAISNPRVSV